MDIDWNKLVEPDSDDGDKDERARIAAMGDVLVLYRAIVASGANHIEAEHMLAAMIRSMPRDGKRL